MTDISSIPGARVRVVRDEPPKQRGAFVLYWMTAQRRTRFNFALQRAIELCNELGKPLLVLEALRVDYRWATARTHRFVIDGMRDNQTAFAASGVRYYPYVEPTGGAGRGLVDALARDACAIVTDDFPCFFLRGLPDRTSERVPIRLEAVDGCGLLPMARGERVFTMAHSFRRHLQKRLFAHLEELPCAVPLETLRVKKRARLKHDIRRRWPLASSKILATDAKLKGLPVSHDVAPVGVIGGQTAALARLESFVSNELQHYGERNHPDDGAGSGLSPWLHFGHIATAEILLAVARREAWTPEEIAESASGSRSGWWGMSDAAEGFLDQVVTWRELGFNMCFHQANHDRYESLPAWARATLETHAHDERPHLYSLEQLDAAATHDEVWNAAQNELRREGRMHNYMRMLWGKKILQWSETPRVALASMIELNNRYALDGRDPNSYSGIFWVLGRYDRAWGPERPIFGKVRYMTSESARRKLRLRRYLDTYASRDDDPGSGSRS